MGFLSEILGRPSNEKPFLLLPVGYPADGAEVPDISKKGLDDISDFIWPLKKIKPLCLKVRLYNLS